MTAEEYLGIEPGQRLAGITFTPWGETPAPIDEPKDSDLERIKKEREEYLKLLREEESAKREKYAAYTTQEESLAKATDILAQSYRDTGDAPPVDLTREPTTEEQAMPKGQRPTMYNRETGQWEEVDPKYSDLGLITPLGVPRSGGGDPRSQGGVLFDVTPWQDRGAQAASRLPLYASTAKGIPIPPPSQEESNALIEAEQAKPGEVPAPAPQSIGKGHSADDFLSGASEPSSKGGYRGPATTFGYNDPQDNGIGFWGTPTNNPHVVGVSLSRRALQENFGPDYEQTAFGKPVQVTNPKTGKSIVAPIVDIGPARWVEARQGSTIDLTHAANQALGGTGKTPMEWKVKLKADDFLSGEEATPQVGKGVSADDFLSGAAEPAAATPAPAQTPVRNQAERAANRQRLITAIDATEKAGYPVEHGIGTPDEPEGDRGPTRDMENLVGALQKMEKDAKDPQKAASIAQARSYWEDQIKTSGMTQAQEDAANAAPIKDIAPTAPETPGGKREVGFWEAANRGLAEEGYGMHRALGQKVIGPAVNDITKLINTIAPGTDFAKYASGLNEEVYNALVSPTGRTGKAIKEQEAKPETEHEGFAAQLGRGLGAMGMDIGVAVPTGAAISAVFPEAAAAGADATAGTVWNMARTLLPRMAKGAGSFALPALKAGVDAQNRAAQSGASPVEQNHEFTKAALQTLAWSSLPLGVESSARNMLLRALDRTAKSVPLAAALSEAQRGVHNLLNPKEQQPFSWQQLAINSAPIILLSGALGHNAQKAPKGPIAEQAFPKGEPAPPMPGGDVKEGAGKPFELRGDEPTSVAEMSAAIDRARTQVPTGEERFAPPVGDYRYDAEQWIKQEQKKAAKTPLGKTSPDAALKVVAERIRKGETPEGPIPDKINEALHRSLAPTKDLETGELHEPGGEHWPSTGTLLDFLESQDQARRPETEPAGVGLVASPKTAAAMEEVKEIGKEVKKAAGVSRTTEFIRAVKEWKYRKQRGAQLIENMHREITQALLKDVKLNAKQVKVRAEGITNYLQAGGDRATLQKWFDVTTDPKLRAGYEAALNLTPREIAAAARVRQIFQDYLHQLRTMGYDVTEFENYVTGMWQAKLSEKMGFGIPRTMSDYFRFKRQKFFENYFAGEQEGKKPLTKDIREILAHYMNTADRAINNRMLLHDMLSMTASDGRPLLSAAGSISVLPRDIEARRQQAQGALDKWREGKLSKFGERNLDRYGDASMKASDRSAKIQEASSNVLEEKLDNLKEQREAALEASGEKTTREFGDKYDRADTDKEKRSIEREHEKKADERSKAVNDYFDAAEKSAQREHDLNVKNADALSKSSEDLLQKHAALQGKTFTDLINDTYAKRQKKIDKMKGMSFLLDPSRIPKNLEGYKSLDFPALKNWKRFAYGQNGDPIYSKVDLLVHPKIAEHLENLFGQSWLDKKLGTPSDSLLKRYTQGITKLLLKDIQQYYKGTLFAGIPSGFHLVHQAGEMGMAFRINPFRGIEKPDLVNNPEHIDMAKHGLMLGPDHASMDLFSEGVGGGQKNLVTLGLRKLAEVKGMGYAANVANGIDATSKWLFGHYIPALGIKAFRAAFPRNMKRFAPELKAGTLGVDDIKDLTANQVNASTGHINMEASQIGSNKNVQQTLSMFLISPHFTVGRLAKVAQAVPAIFGARKGREQMVGLGITAAMLYLSSRVLNLITDGDPHFEWQRAFQVKMGDRWVGMRSIPGDAQRALPEEWGGQNFGPWFFNRMSPYAHLASSVFTGYNSRGQKVSPGRALYDMFLGGTPMPVQGLTTRMTQLGSADKLAWWEHLAGSMGFPIQRYNPTSEVKQDALAWQKKNKPLTAPPPTLGPSKYSNLEFALEENDPGRIKEEIANLKDQGMTIEKIVQGYAERIDHPYTSSQENDKAFSKSNFADQKKLAISRTRKMALIGRLQAATGIRLKEPRDAQYFLERGQ